MGRRREAGGDCGNAIRSSKREDPKKGTVRMRRKRQLEG
jgi:hypothetical protein